MYSPLSRSWAVRRGALALLLGAGIASGPAQAKPRFLDP